MMETASSSSGLARGWFSACGWVGRGSSGTDATADWRTLRLSTFVKNDVPVDIGLRSKHCNEVCSGVPLRAVKLVGDVRRLCELKIFLAPRRDFRSLPGFSERSEGRFTKNGWRTDHSGGR